MTDYAARQKVGGTHLKYHVFKQLPAAPSSILGEPTPWQSEVKIAAWLLLRVLELTYTAWEMEPFARCCGYEGPPFCWGDERRFLIRCEIDAAFFHLYGINRDDAEYIMDTFPIVKRKDEEKFGEYRTKRVILEIYDAMSAAIRTGQPYATRLDPPPGPPKDRLPEWPPGTPRPATWPPHIHEPKKSE